MHRASSTQIARIRSSPPRQGSTPEYVFAEWDSVVNAIEGLPML